RAVHLAPARVVAGAESDAHAKSRAAHPRRAQGARRPDRDARRRRRPPPDGRSREDDPRPARRRARRQAEGHAELLLIPSRYPKEPPHRRPPMRKFVIEPHFRLQEWVAEEKGYFKDEGLDYVFQELIQSSDGQHHYKGDKVGAYQSFERGRTSNVRCACH